MRKPLIAGNWKMNKTPSEAAGLAKEIAALNIPESVEAAVCVPFTAIDRVGQVLKDAPIAIGAQNMYFEEAGAYTGEVSPLMLKDLGVTYVVLGHSERREIFGEDDLLINKKVKSALAHGLKPILCCGETLEEREAGTHEDKVGGQIRADLEGVTEEELKDVVIAYEPIWAIGTGKTASAEDADAMCGFIRKGIEGLYSKAAADAIRIQYGGSVNPGNVVELMGKENIDGALVGGASLKSADFNALVNY